MQRAVMSAQAAPNRRGAEQKPQRAVASTPKCPATPLPARANSSASSSPTLTEGKPTAARRPGGEAGNIVALPGRPLTAARLKTRFRASAETPILSGGGGGLFFFWQLGECGVNGSVFGCGAVRTWDAGAHGPWARALHPRTVSGRSRSRLKKKA